MRYDGLNRAAWTLLSQLLRGIAKGLGALSDRAAHASARAHFNSRPSPMLRHED